MSRSGLSYCVASGCDGRIVSKVAVVLQSDAVKFVCRERMGGLSPFCLWVFFYLCVLQPTPRSTICSK